ncbi:MAG: HAMP domain-containing histidine kinase [Bacteroidota bacterium]|nr:HAMP domain-containing histidine kinase [Bacteroidota bacterium]
MDNDAGQKVELKKKGNKSIDLLTLNKEKKTEIEQRIHKLEIANREISLFNEELKKMNLAKDRIISIISHDLKNPISAILASSEGLLNYQQKVSSEESTHLGKIINKASKKIITQLDDLVEWSKTKKVSVIFVPSKINLFNLVTESLLVLEQLAEQKQIRVTNDISPSVFVEADKVMLRSIIQNLVTNSIKFTPFQGTVTIKAEICQISAFIKIEDTGKGMTEKEKEGIFTDNGFLRKGTNYSKNGLGFVLVKEFIEKHGGIFRIDTKINQGTSFVFSIPLYK